MNMVDAALAGIVAVSAQYGVWKGFFRQIFGIVVMVASTVASVLYFRLGGGIIGAGVVFFVTGLVLHVAFLFWRKSVKKDAALTLVSRVGGGIVGAAIGLIYAVLILVFLPYLSVLAPAGSGFVKSIAGSRLFGAYNAAIARSKGPGAAVPGNMGAQGIIIDEREMESLHKNPTIKAMLEDKEFTALIEKKDIAGLMAHPMFRRIMSDPQLVKELTAAALNAGPADGK